ncbi:hypothetical protein N2152v2_006205 [Parachlorella kessleri]
MATPLDLRNRRREAQRAAAEGKVCASELANAILAEKDLPALVLGPLDGIAGLLPAAAVKLQQQQEQHFRKLQACLLQLKDALHVLRVALGTVSELLEVEATSLLLGKGAVFAALSLATIGKLLQEVVDMYAAEQRVKEAVLAGFEQVPEFNLVCGTEWALQLVQFCFFAGVLLGCVLFQLASGRFGRRRLLYTASTLSGIAGVMCCTAPSLWLYMLFRGLTGLATGGLGLAAFAVGTESCGPSWRSLAGLLLQIFFSVGACLATLLASVAPGWRALTLLSALASLAYVGTWSYVNESPSWLLLRGRKGEATAAIAAIAFANRSRPPELPLADPTAFLANPQSRLRDLLAHGKLRQRLLLSGVGWFAAGLAYYGSLLLLEPLSGWDATSRGDGSVYITALMGFSYEIPGVAAAGLAAERVGRKYTLVAAFAQAGGSLIAAALTNSAARRALAVAARFGLAAAYATLFLISAELYPAVVRNQGMATGNYCARVGTAVSPVLALLVALHVRGGCLVPLLVAGGVCLAGGATVLFLPETLNNPCPETIQEMDVASIKRQKSWTIALRQMFRSKARQKEEDDTVIMRSA